MSKVENQGLLTLNTRVSNLTYLPAVEVRPPSSIELLVKLENPQGVRQIHERITNVAFVLEVNRQVEEIIFAFKLRVNLLQEHLLGVLVRDVLNHDCGAIVFASQDLLEV